MAADERSHARVITRNAKHGRPQRDQESRALAPG
jgi:hypothetical protein